MSLDRISVFLEEDEVSEQVSTLKKTDSGPPAADAEVGLGIEHGSFKWNEVEETKEAKSGDAVQNPGDNSPTLTVEAEGELVESRFELRDIDVMFPEGQLSLVTGPTASGKTALLVRDLLAGSLEYVNV